MNIAVLLPNVPSCSWQHPSHHYPMKQSKTIAMKLLEGKRVSYSSHVYPNGLRDAGDVAAAIDAPPEQVFKTLVVMRPSAKPLLVMIPAPSQLFLKKLAKVVKEKKVKMATQREAEALTGLQVGGISALALVNKRFAVYLDETAVSHTHIFVSAGIRGIQIQLPVKDLIKITRARTAVLCLANSNQ